jgi:hypothetical protein
VTALGELHPGDRFRLVMTDDSCLEVGGRGVVERVVERQNRRFEKFACTWVRFDDGQVAGLVEGLGDRVEKIER